MADPVCSVIIPNLRCREFLPAASAFASLLDVDGGEALVFDRGVKDDGRDWPEGRPAEMPGPRIFRSGGSGSARVHNMLKKCKKSEPVASRAIHGSPTPRKLAAEPACLRADLDVVMAVKDCAHAGDDGQARGTRFDFRRPEWIDRSSRLFRRLACPDDALPAVNAVDASRIVAKREALRKAGGFSAIFFPAVGDRERWLRIAESSARVAAKEDVPSRNRDKVGRAAHNAARTRLVTVSIEAASAVGRNCGLAATAVILLTPPRRAARSAMALATPAAWGGLRR